MLGTRALCESLVAWLQEDNGYDATRGTWLDLEMGELVDTPRELMDQIAAADAAMMLSSSEEEGEGEEEEMRDEHDAADGGARRLSRLPLSAQRLLRHCRRHYNTIFAQQPGAARLPSPSPGPGPDGDPLCSSSSEQAEIDLQLLERPTAWSRFSWQDFGISSKARAAGRSWSHLVRQLMAAGSVAHHRRHTMRFPQDDTELDGVDLAVQMRLLRRYADYEMLSSGALPGGRIARWLQRLHWPRPPKVVGVWFNRPGARDGQEAEQEVLAQDCDLEVPASFIKASFASFVPTPTAARDHLAARGQHTRDALPAAVRAAVSKYAENSARLQQVPRHQRPLCCCCGGGWRCRACQRACSSAALGVM